MVQTESLRVMPMLDISSLLLSPQEGETPHTADLPPWIPECAPALEER